MLFLEPLSAATQPTAISVLTRSAQLVCPSAQTCVPWVSRFMIPCEFAGGWFVFEACSGPSSGCQVALMFCAGPSCAVTSHSSQNSASRVGLVSALCAENEGHLLGLRIKGRVLVILATCTNTQRHGYPALRAPVPILLYSKFSHHAVGPSSLIPRRCTSRCWIGNP